MIVAESVKIDIDKLVDSISLEDLIHMRDKNYFRIDHSRIIYLLIILKKLSEYLKQHSSSLLSRLSLFSIISYVNKICQDLYADYEDWDEFRAFTQKFKNNEIHSELGTIVLFYADKALEKLERNLANVTNN